MARNKFAVGGNAIDRRNYWFDESYGATNDNNYTPEPTSQPTNDVANIDTNISRTIRQRTQQTNSQRTTSNNSSSDIVTIGTRTFSTAFKQARVAGLDKFRWKGKVYGTRLAGAEGNTTKEKAANTAKQSTQKTRKQPATTTPNKNTQAPLVNVAAQPNRQTTPQRQQVKQNNVSRKPVMSWRDYVDAARQDPSIKNTSGYKAARKQEFERMRTRAAGPGTKRWANNKQPGQGNPGYQTRYVYPTGPYNIPTFIVPDGSTIGERHKRVLQQNNYRNGGRVKPKHGYRLSYTAPADNTRVVQPIYPLVPSMNPVNAENELYLRSMYNPTQVGDYRYYGDPTYDALDSILMRRAYDYDAAARAYGQGLSIPFGPAYNRREKARKAYKEARTNLNSYRKTKKK